MSVIMPVPHYFNHYIFKIYFKIRKLDPSSFVFFPQDCFGNLEPCVLTYEFYDCFSFTVKHFFVIMIKIALKTQRQRKTEKKKGIGENIFKSFI
jgi:hypothetical protein